MGMTFRGRYYSDIREFLHYLLYENYKVDRANRLLLRSNGDYINFDELEHWCQMHFHPDDYSTHFLSRIIDEVEARNGAESKDRLYHHQASMLREGYVPFTPKINVDYPISLAIEKRKERLLLIEAKSNG